MIPYKRAAIVSRVRQGHSVSAHGQRRMLSDPQRRFVRAARSEMTIALAYAMPLALILWMAIALFLKFML